MDKYDLVLDIIEHPGNYTSCDLEAILEDPETREIYNLLCKTDSALIAHEEEEVDVDSEWEAFSRKSGFILQRFRMRGVRAASVITIICSSLVAMALGVVVTMAVIDRKAKPETETKVLNSAVSVDKDNVKTQDNPSENGNSDTAQQEEGSSILFEDMPLSTVIETICATYNVEVKYDNDEVGSLHLYFRFDPSMSLDEVVSQLNTFESINITKEGNILTVD